MPIDQPSSSTQMLRVGMPLTFMTRISATVSVTRRCFPDFRRRCYRAKPGGSMPVDYEAEYNNRARVPEHPYIFARWTREAEDYRREAMKERRAELGLSYGSTPRQVIDLFLPRPDVTAPLALFIHGGYWRS